LVASAPGENRLRVAKRLSPAALRLKAAYILCEQWGLVPTPDFLRGILPAPKELFLCGGWQFGKSSATAFIVAHDIMMRVLNFLPRQERPYRYWFIMPSYQTKPKEMDYLLQWLTKSGVVTASSFPQGGSCSITVLGGKFVIETRTAMDPEGIASEACDIVLACEAGQQSPLVYEQVQGRIMTFGGRCVFSGTLEDTEGKPTWLWYEDAVAKYLERPDKDHIAVSLPSWANPVYMKGETCQLAAEGCENHEHGRQHPTIAALETTLGGFAFERKIAGVPKGTQNPVYPMLEHSDGFYDVMGVPAGHDGWIRSMGAGGHDYGSGQAGKSPSVLAIATVNNLDEIWLQEVRVNYSADVDWIESNRRAMSAAFWVPLHRWGYDPMQRYAATVAGAVNPETKQPYVSTGSGRRERVAGMTYARFMARKLFFNMSGAGVPQAFRQMQRVHRRKKMVAGQGEVWEYARVDDDMAAAIENIVEVVDTKGKINWRALSEPEPVAAKPRQAVSFGGPLR
jgi:hypothetical protein